MLNNFELTIDELLFSDGGQEAFIKGRLLIGKQTIAVFRVIKYTQMT